MSCNPYLSPGINYSDLALTQTQIAVLLNNFQNTIGYSPSGAYTQEQLVGGIVFLETLVRNISANPVFLNAYPQTITRIMQGAPISELEYEEFLRFSGVNTDPNFYQDIYDEFVGTFTGTGVLIADIIDINQCPDEIQEYLDAIEAFNTDNYGSQTTGSFCSVFNGVLDAFFKIQEIALTVPTVFKGIEELLKKLVDTIKEKVEGIVNGLIQQAFGFVGQVKALMHRVQNFFSEENIENIKKQIEGFIGLVSNKFEELTPEVIKYLLFKFCQLSSAVEQLMMGPQKAVSDITSRIQGAKEGLATQSSVAAAEIVRNGGLIIDPSKIDRVKNNIIDKANPRTAGSPRSDGSVGEANYTTRGITLETGATTFEVQGAAAIAAMTVDQAKSNSHPFSEYVDVSGIAGQGYSDISDWDTYSNIALKEGISLGSRPSPEDPWKKVQPHMWIRLYRIGRRMNKKIRPISAARAIAKQYGIYYRHKDRRSKAGLTPIWDPSAVAYPSLNAPHVSGRAFDIANGGIKVNGNLATFIKVCSQEGIIRFGFYGSEGFTHIDTLNKGRSAYRKAGLNSIETRALNDHIADKFREGKTDSGTYDETPIVTPEQIGAAANTIPTTPTTLETEDPRFTLQSIAPTPEQIEEARRRDELREKFGALDGSIDTRTFTLEDVINANTALGSTGP